MIIRQNEQGQPHRGALAAFPKQNDKCPTNAWGGWARLELTEPLSCKVAFD